MREETRKSWNDALTAASTIGIVLASLAGLVAGAIALYTGATNLWDVITATMVWFFIAGFWGIILTEAVTQFMMWARPRNSQEQES